MTPCLFVCHYVFVCLQVLSMRPVKLELSQLMYRCISGSAPPSSTLLQTLLPGSCQSPLSEVVLQIKYQHHHNGSITSVCYHHVCAQYCYHYIRASKS